MKKGIILGLLGLLVFSYASTALAETPRMQNRAEIRGDQGPFLTRATAFGERAVTRLTLAVERLRGHITRVEGRVEAFRANGKFDVEAVETLLEGAKADLEIAEEKIAELPEELKAALTDESPSTAFRNMRELIRAVMPTIRTAGQKIVQAIIIIRGGNTN